MAGELGFASSSASFCSESGIQFNPTLAASRLLLTFTGFYRNSPRLVANGRKFCDRIHTEPEIDSPDDGGDLEL